MNPKYCPPYFGAAYYPEDWPETELEPDIRRMQEAGVNVVRIGEFAWKKMEPQEGRFEFEWLHRLIDRLADAGIGVILGTPTATPPVWLPRKYPDVLAETENGRRMQHGGRRHCCSNNPHYREYSARITEKLAEEFGRDANVVGWQIDNEIYTKQLGCFCEHCRAEFLKTLEEKYGEIEEVNRAWNLNLFSQAYDGFEDVPQPRDAWHNPHLLLEWRTFQNDSHIRFVHMQAEILKRWTDAPIGTDTMPFHAMNYRKMTEKLDVVQFNHYNTPDDMIHCALWFDYLRTLKDRPFWNTETQTTWNGSVVALQSIKPDGFCRMNSWLPIALGGEANLYWLWRTHWAGHELIHGAVLDNSGKPMYPYDEVRQTAEEFQKAADFINGTKVSTPVAFHMTSRSWNLFETQPIVKGFNYMETVVGAFYQPINDSGLRPDVIDTAQELSSYRLVFSPLVMTLEEDGLPERLRRWVEDGGVWVAGPLTDIRTQIGAKYIDRHYGMIERLTGVNWLYGVPDTQGMLRSQWSDGAPFSGDQWYDLFDEADAPVQVVAGHRAVKGKAVVVKKRVGKGCVILLGTMPDRDSFRRIIADACREAGVAPFRMEGSLIVSPRRGKSGNGLILTEYNGGEAFFELPADAVDRFTGERLSGRIRLDPYEVKVLQYAPGAAL